MTVFDDTNLTSLIGSSDTSILFDLGNSNVYEGSDIDNYLENIYYPSSSIPSIEGI